MVFFYQSSLPSWNSGQTRLPSALGGWPGTGGRGSRSPGPCTSQLPSTERRFCPPEADFLAPPPLPLPGPRREGVGSDALSAFQPPQPLFLSKLKLTPAGRWAALVSCALGHLHPDLCRQPRYLMGRDALRSSCAFPPPAHTGPPRQGPRVPLPSRGIGRP